MRSEVLRAAALVAAAILAGSVAPDAQAAAAALTDAGAGSADRVYRHGYVYTVDARDSVQRALAIRAGFEPHMHADGDRAVREGLDGIGALRRKFPDRMNCTRISGPARSRWESSRI
jgi:hypothetical protein